MTSEEEPVDQRAEGVGLRQGGELIPELGVLQEPGRSAIRFQRPRQAGDALVRRLPGRRRLDSLNEYLHPLFFVLLSSTICSG